MRLRFERIPEEHQHVDAPLGDHRSDLLIATHRAAVESGDGETEFVDEHSTGCSGGPELTGREFPEMTPGPVEQRWLLVVMGDQRESWSLRIP